MDASLDLACPHVCLSRNRSLQTIPDDFSMSALLSQVLEESGFAESRASKMDVDDFLKCVRVPTLLN